MIELRDYQKEISAKAARLLATHGLCYLSMECRTGKTLTALETARLFGATCVLVITKKKAIPSIHHDHELLDSPFLLDVINYESAGKITSTGNVAKAGKAYDIVILDEAHSLGAFPKPGKRTMDVRRICVGLPVLYLSGTPSPESYSQLYHQFWVCSHSPWAKFKTFYKWAHIYVDIVPKKINGYNINDYSHARKDLIDRDVRHLFIDYSQEDAGFSCNINERVLTVPMAEITREYLSAIRRDRIVYIDGDAVLADTPAKLMSKMHQLSSGTVITEDGERLITDRSKAEFVRDMFGGRKIAVFYVFQSEADLLHEQFPNWTDSPEEFQTRDDLVFICQVKRAREGVRLDTADALIFFNIEFSYLSYEQGRNRLVSKERKEAADVYFLISDCGIEADIIEAVHGKRDFTASYYFSKRKDRLL